MSYVLIIPIFNLKLSKDIKEEMKIENVHFVSKEKLLRNIKKYGLPYTFSELNKLLKGKPDQKKKIKLLKDFLKDNEIETFSIIRVTTDHSKDILRGFKQLQEILFILASSQFGFIKRNRVIHFGAPQYSINIWNKYCLLPSKLLQELYKIEYRRRTPIKKYEFGKEWKKYKQFHFLPSLIDLLNRKIKANKKWIVTLRNAAIMAGKSIFSEDIALAFLFNMIGIERLLKRKNEKYMDVMPKRLNDFLGWVLGKDEKKSYNIIKKQVERLYYLRNKFVHEGETSEIKITDLLLSDYYLFNLLQNFCRLYKVFSDKKSILNFSKEMEARRILGMKIKRPKKLRSLQLRYTFKDIEEIEQKNSWPS